MLRFMDFLEQMTGQDTEVWTPKTPTADQPTAKPAGDLPPLKDVMQNVFNQLRKQQLEKSKTTPLKYAQNFTPAQPPKKSSFFGKLLGRG